MRSADKYPRVPHKEFPMRGSGLPLRRSGRAGPSQDHTKTSSNGRARLRPEPSSSADWRRKAYPGPTCGNSPARSARTLWRQGLRMMQMQSRSEEHTSELQSIMRNSYAIFRVKKKNKDQTYKYPANKLNTKY